MQQILVDVRMLDGTEYEAVLVVTADRMKLAETGRRHKWGTLADDPDRSITFLAWHALYRLGKFSGSFNEFVDKSETVNASGAVDVDPTQKATSAD